jgi:thiosulfate dehydrogenase [quinone] large subunit
METLKGNSEPKVALSWLALLRIMIGVMFLTTWFSNLQKGFYTPEGLLDFFTTVFPQSQNPLAWYAGFIQSVILPARGMFAPFQLVAEFLLGAGLLLGVLTRAFSLAGIFFLLNTFLATFGHDWPWAYGLPMGMLGIIFLTGAGQSLGLDAYLMKRFGQRGFWLW